MKEYKEKDLIVKYHGKGVMINPVLLRKQGIKDKETVEELKLTHEDRLRIFEAMENTDDPEDLKEFAWQMECLEFEQQKLWGFPLNRDFHRWWEVPKCRCPHMDNLDEYPSKYRIISGKCPVHSIEDNPD